MSIKPGRHLKKKILFPSLLNNKTIGQIDLKGAQQNSGNVNEHWRNSIMSPFEK